VSRNSVKHWVIRAAVLSAFGAGAIGFVHAENPAPQGPPYGQNINCPHGSGGGYGPGMMGGMGMGGYGPGGMMGPGGGYGPGMQGGMGMNPGMGGYGPGMMGGMGMGPGMMGEGMMGMGPLFMLNLSDEQRGKITKIMDEERQKHWQVMGQMMTEQNTLRDLYQADTPDAKKIGAAYEAIARHQRQMIETHIEMRNKAEQLLTKEQREQLHNWRRGMGGPGWGMGYGRMGQGPMQPGQMQPGQMGPGPMGPGYGPRGSGPGMMGP